MDAVCSAFDVPAVDWPPHVLAGAPVDDPFDLVAAPFQRENVFGTQRVGEGACHLGYLQMQWLAEASPACERPGAGVAESCEIGVGLEIFRAQSRHGERVRRGSPQALGRG